MNLIDLRAKEVLVINGGDKKKAIQYIISSKDKFAGYNGNKNKEAFWKAVVNTINNY